jgi:SAM-dependent methyltransferase
MKDNLKQVYNEIGGYYDKARPLWPQMKVWAKDVKSRDLVLDVGCGEGRLLQELEPNVDYTGVDFSQKLLEVAKTRYKGKSRKFVTGDITKEDIWRKLGKFDKIFVVAVIHHFKNMEEQLYVLKKIKDHLKPDGKVYVSSWNLWQKKFLGEHFRNVRLKLGALPESLRWVEIPFRKTNIRRFYFAGGKRYWEKLLTQAGWKNVKINIDKNKKNMWAVLG